MIHSLQLLTIVTLLTFQSAAVLGQLCLPGADGYITLTGSSHLTASSPTCDLQNRDFSIEVWARLSATANAASSENFFFGQGSSQSSSQYAHFGLRNANAYMVRDYCTQRRHC